MTEAAAGDYEMEVRVHEVTRVFKSHCVDVSVDSAKPGSSSEVVL